MENRNRPITSTEIETVIKDLPTNRNRGPDGFTGEFYQTLREELISILLKFFQNIAQGETLSNSFYEVTITPIRNQTKILLKKRKLHVNTSDEIGRAHV